WRTFGGDIVGAALYVVNWVLAARSVDYLAEGVGVSPVQHFWSLAGEEEFYIGWPLVLVLVGWWVRRGTRARLRRVGGGGGVLVHGCALVVGAGGRVGASSRSGSVAAGDGGGDRVGDRALVHLVGGDDGQ